MAPSTEDWESHRETILNLRFNEKLPLDHSKTGDRSIVQVMRDECQFHAKASQYETQLKKWGAGKNLKKHDWQEIIPAYDNLTRMGLKPRVRHGNQVLDERKIKKARRYLNPTNHNTCASIVPPSQPRVWTIETCQENGQYAEYPSGQAGFEAQVAMEYPSQQDGFDPCDSTDWSTLAQVTTENGDFDMGRGTIQSQSSGAQLTPEIPTPSALILSHTDNGSWEGNGLPLQPNPTLVPGDAFNINENRPSLAIFQPTSFTAHNESEDMGILFSTFLAQDPSTSPFLRELGSIDAGSLVRNEIQGSINSIDSGLRLRYSLSIDCIQPLLQHLSQDRRNHRAATILDDLNSLSYKEYFEQNMGDAFQLITVGAFPMSEIHKTILYSILNNFAGLENIPLGSVFTMLKNDPMMRSCLFNGLRSTNVSIGKALAGNLFRAALEAGDEEVVGIILETTFGRANEIDPNQFICHYKGEFYRPIALASYLKHFEMVQKLLSFNAKVNLASNNGVIGDALHMTVRRVYRRDKTNDQVHQNIDKIAGALLMHGAEGNVRFIAAMLHINPASEVLERLLQAVQRDHHIQFWIPSASGAKAYDGTETPILELIVSQMGEHQAEKTIRSIIRICHTMGCTPPCGMKYPDTMRRVMCAVIEKGNASLVEYLDYSKPDIVYLTAAIRTGRPEIIALMLKQDIYPSGAVVYLQDMSCSRPAHEQNKTTPLAEAIRLQNDELIQYLEDHGALMGVQDKTGSEFDAAVLAAAEVGDIRYLKRLLALVPSLAKRSNIHRALQVTMKKGYIEMAKILIIQMAKNDQRPNISRENEWILLAAIKSRKIEIMNTLFEYLNFYGGYPHYAIFYEAVRWGEKSIIEDLLQWGVPLPTSSRESPPSAHQDGRYSPLVAAIYELKPELVTLFLEWGVDPSELGHAIKAGDETIMSLLLHHGAEPADEEAFFFLP